MLSKRLECLFNGGINLYKRSKIILIVISSFVIASMRLLIYFSRVKLSNMNICGHSAVHPNFITYCGLGASPVEDI